MMSLFRHVNKKLGQDAPHLPNNPDAYMFVTGRNATYTLSMADEETREAWEKYYSLGSGEPGDLDAFHSAIDEVIDDSMGSTKVRNMLSAVADNLTPRTMLLVVAGFQNESIFESQKYGISAPSLYQIFDSVVNNTELPVMAPPKDERLIAQHPNHENVMAELKAAMEQRPRPEHKEEESTAEAHEDGKEEEQKESLINEVQAPVETAVLEFHDAHLIENGEAYLSEENQKVFKAAMKALFLSVEKSLPAQTPRLPNVDSIDVLNENSTFVLSSMDQDTWNAWERFYSQDADKPGDLSTFRAAIQTLIADKDTPEAQKNLLTAFADNLTPHAMMLAISAIQYDSLTSITKEKITTDFPTLADITKSLVNNAELPAMPYPEEPLLGLKANHENIMRMIGGSVPAAELSEDDAPAEERKSELKPEPAEAKPEPAAAPRVRDPLPNHAYSGPNLRNALDTFGWTPVKVEKSRVGWMPITDCKDFAKEFDRLRQRLLNTKRTLSFLQGNSTGFDRMVSSLEHLCTLTDSYHTMEDFRSAAFSSALADVVSSAYQYQYQHQDPELFRDNTYRKVRLKTAAELELCADLFQQGVTLRSKEGLDARLKLKTTLADCLCGQNDPARAARPDELGKSINDQPSMIQTEDPKLDQYESLLKLPSAQYWTRMQKAKEKKTKGKSTVPTKVQQNTKQAGGMEETTQNTRPRSSGLGSK